MTLGVCMKECEEAILADITSLQIEGKLFRYLEIGIDHAETLLGVCQHIRSIRKDDKWLVVGVDIPGWDVAGLRQQFKDFPNVILSDEGSPKIFRHPEWKNGLEFCLIDGCHGYDCA